MKKPISALIITKNEEKNISRCLSSLLWADEIIIIDGQSTDQTKQICLDPGQPWKNIIRWQERPWTGFKDQRNEALNLAKNDWVFVIDADECCSPELALKISDLFLKGEPEHQAYKVRRQEYFLNTPINYGIWNPSYQDRFFLKQGVRYINDVHEYPVFKSSPQKIHEPILHDPHFNPHRFFEKMNRYTSIEAMDRIQQGQRTNLLRVFFAFFAMFYKNYVYYQAYKDGKVGFVISVMEGISRAVRHVKMWSLQRDLK